MNKWIGKMHLKKGALGRQASAAGESTAAFARKHEHDSGVTGKRARLAETFASIRAAHDRRRGK